jgi:hypothetical protein
LSFSLLTFCSFPASLASSLGVEMSASQPGQTVSFFFFFFYQETVLFEFLACFCYVGVFLALLMLPFNSSVKDEIKTTKGWASLNQNIRTCILPSYRGVKQ